MTNIQEWTHVDKSGWGDGEWQNEPDKRQWVDAASGLDCLMVRHPSMGQWCGYVGVPESHPEFKKEYDDVGVDVHGGLTFSGVCQENAVEGHGICHIPEPGRPHLIWWLGFDCAHLGDLTPYEMKKGRDVGYFSESTYKNVKYVERQVVHLAAQLKEME